MNNNVLTILNFHGVMAHISCIVVHWHTLRHTSKALHLHFTFLTRGEIEAVSVIKKIIATYQCLLFLAELSHQFQTVPPDIYA